MKILVTPLLLLFSVYYLHAQDVPVSYKNDIGFNTTFVFQGIFQSDQTPFSLMYKKYKAEHKAWRFGFDTYFNINKTDTKTSTSTFDDYSSGNFAAVAGLELQKQIDKRWVWYYGGDFVPYITFSNRDSYLDGELFMEEDFNGFGLGFRPFLGIRFDLSPRLYLSAEANITLSYGRRTNYRSFTGNPTPLTDTETSTFTVSASPATGLFLFYRF
jgi:hypothetical protein